MTLDRNTLYVLLFTACLVGYIWLYFSVATYATANGMVEVCLIKSVTSIPCPSCGATRSVVSLTKGDFIGALSINPIGYIVAIIMIVAPALIIADALTGRSTLLNIYQKIDSYPHKPMYAIPLGILVMVNWIWSIAKGL